MKSSDHIEAVRAFNRFYTKQIGILRDGLLYNPFSLAETRVLYELAHRRDLTAKELCRDLDLDPGYLSRTLRDFGRRNLVARHPVPSDGRSCRLALTVLGHKQFSELEARSNSVVEKMLAHLSGPEQQRLVAAMRSIETALAPRDESTESASPVRRSYNVRHHRPGDMGWVVARHGSLYASEYGYDMRFEALVAEIVAHFVQNFDSKRERCWIAEMDGEPVGSVFLVKLTDKVAKLRLLLVEPRARGLGIGKRLVDECIRFARERGYKKIKLWTQSELDAARGIYRAAGFTIIGRKRHRDFGKPLVAETWELKL
jgi:DNA-binding MarR family transcriptional regulator/GNAT superfamily N-acetyltransferase